MLRRARWCAGSAAPLLLTVAIALVVVLQAPNTLAQGASSVRCPAPDAVSMQLRWLKNGQFAGYYAAEAAGYYVEECLDVELRQRRGGDTAEELVLRGDADFATPWAMSDVVLREANRTSYRTLAQVFNRPGSTMLVRNLYVPNRVSSLQDLPAEARRLGRPVKIGVNDDMFAFWARLSELGVRTCGAWSAPRKTGPACVPGDEVELLERDLNGLRNMKLPQNDPGFIDIYSGHINDLSNILQAVAADGELVGSTDRVHFVEVGGVELLEDGVCASQEWLSQPGSEEIARRFLRATMKGWLLCRDSPRTCAEMIEPQDIAQQREFLFQIVEMNKLIWPAPVGIGGLDTIHFQRQYDYLAEVGVASRSYDASTNVVPGIISGVIANLAGEGRDVYGFRYATEGNQRTLEYCVDEQGGQPVLCAMRCNPEGHSAPSAGMAQCVTPSSAPQRALTVGLVVAATVVVLLVILGALLFLRSQALERELEAMQNADTMDTDAPFVKVLGFLQELGQGKHGHVLQPWKQGGMERKARELRAMLLRSENIAVPDIQSLMAGHYSDDLVQYVAQHTAQDKRPDAESMHPVTRQLSSTSSFSRESSRRNSDGFMESPELEQELCKVGKFFNLDALYLHSHCPTGVLGQVVMRLSTEWGLQKRLGISVSKLALFVRVIESGFFKNPYHGLPRAIDVTARMGTILNKSGIAGHLSAPSMSTDGHLTLLAALLSALVADYKHAGVNNQFLVASEQHLAIRYNDQSCLENHALYEALGLMRHPDYSFTQHLPKAKQHFLRSLIVKMVLATDLGQHFTIITNVQTKLQELANRNEAPGIRYSSLASEKQLLLLQLCLKCADMGHCALPSKLHVRWTQGIQEEMWAQGDREKSLGLAISPLANRSKPGALWGGNQIGFFQALVCPMYNMLAAVAPECHELQAGVYDNLDFWRKNPKAPPAEMLRESEAVCHHMLGRRLSKLGVVTSPTKMDGSFGINGDDIPDSPTQGLACLSGDDNAV
eukprot:jgi/Tetstr1/457208/TSEL_043856.t1